MLNDLPDTEKVIKAEDLIVNYNEYGSVLRKPTELKELAEKINSIVEAVESKLMAESDDWFDRHTINRNLKELKSYAKDFTKLASEADTYTQRMTALYDDVGRILERYFDIKKGSLDGTEDDSSDEKLDKDQLDMKDAERTNSQDRTSKLDVQLHEDETSGMSSAHDIPDSNINPSTGIDDIGGSEQSFKRLEIMKKIADANKDVRAGDIVVDAMSARAYIFAHHALKSPEQQKTLDTLPLSQALRVIWKVIAQKMKKSSPDV